MTEYLSGFGLFFWVMVLPLLLALIVGAVIGTRALPEPSGSDKEKSSGCLSYILLEGFGCLWFLVAASVASSDGFGVLDGYAFGIVIFWIVGLGSVQALLILLAYSLGRLAGRVVTWIRSR